jgi:hypothetical protein
MKKDSSNHIETSSSTNQTNRGNGKPVNKRLEAALLARKSPDFFPIQLGRFAKIKKTESN